MELFRKLSGNIFFKIILAFVALTFVLFGVSGFILGNPNSWVVKVGSTSIGSTTLNKAMQSDREMILNSNKSEEALKYLESEKFKSDVLGRIVNHVMIEKLHEDFGVEASKKIILESVAKNPNFKKDGKFDHEAFKKFLAKNGLNEEKYISEIANEVTATMVIQSLSLAAPMNDKFIVEAENFKQEKRLADVVTISIKNVGNVEASTAEEVQKFYEENKAQYAVPEMRQVSYLHFSKADFAKDLQISDAELSVEYEQNKDQFLKPESRNFYQIMFSDEGAAKAFLQKLNDVAKADKSKLKAEFVKLAKDQEKKDLKAITLNDITEKGLTPELAAPIFKMKIGDVSEVLQSQIGFHIFLLTEVKLAQPISFADAKEGIKKKMLSGREEKVLQSKISAIDDELLTSNSLEEVAKKFGLKLGNSSVKIDKTGQGENAKEVSEIKGFDGFSENSFALKKGQVSKIFFNKDSTTYYSIKVEEVIAARSRDFAEVKLQVSADFAAQAKQNALHNLANKIGAELKSNPSSMAQIVATYQLKLEKNHEFPRIFYVNFQGRQVPYQNKFLEELFSVKVGEATSVITSGPQEFTVGILRSIKKPSSIDEQKAKKEAEEGFRNDIMQEFNKALLAKYPVKVNEKIFGNKEKEAAQ